VIWAIANWEICESLRGAGSCPAFALCDRIQYTSSYGLGSAGACCIGITSWIVSGGFYPGVWILGGV